MKKTRGSTLGFKNCEIYVQSCNCNTHRILWYFEKTNKSLSTVLKNAVSHLCLFLWYIVTSVTSVALLMGYIFVYVSTINNFCISFCSFSRKTSAWIFVPFPYANILWFVNRASTNVMQLRNLIRRHLISLSNRLYPDLVFPGSSARRVKLHSVTNNPGKINP